MSWNVSIWIQGAASDDERFEMIIGDEETLRKIEAAIEFGNPISVVEEDGERWRFQGGEAVVMKAVKR